LFRVLSGFPKALERNAGVAVKIVSFEIMTFWTSSHIVQPHVPRASTSNSQLSHQSVYESSVIIPDALPLPTCMTL